MRSACLVLLLMLASPLQAGQLRTCVEEDICSSIIFNQLAIASLQEDMKSLVKALNSTTKPETSADKEELNRCLERATQLEGVVGSLENKYQQIMSKDQGKNEETENLRREVENLQNAQTRLEGEKQGLEEVIRQQGERIKNLTLMAFKPVDCADIANQGQTESGVYTIYPYVNDESIEVLCDLESDGGGWTVFLARQPQDEPLEFNESWENFRKGFGNVNTEYWLGNDLIHTLTSREDSSLRIDAEIYDGERRWATWNRFSADDEDSKYKLTLDLYDAASTMGDSLSGISGSFFTTFNVDNDESSDVNCAIGTPYSGWGKGGFWYKACGSARPTAPLKNTDKWDSCCWGNWGPAEPKLVSFKTLFMKFRRNNYVELPSSWAKYFEDL